MVVFKLTQYFIIFTTVLLTSNLCFSSNDSEENELHNNKDYYHSGKIASHSRHHTRKSLSTENRPMICAKYSNTNTLKTQESFSIEYPSDHNEINKTSKWLHKIIYKNPESIYCNGTKSVCFAIWQNRSSSEMNKKKDNIGFRLNSMRGCLDDNEKECAGRSRCIASQDSNFCCCDTPMCNAEMLIIPSTPKHNKGKATSVPPSYMEMRKDPSNIWNVAVISLVPPLLVSIITVLGFLLYRLCSTKTSSNSTASLNSLDTKSAPLLPPPSPTFSLHTALVMAKASGNPAALLTAEMLKQIELLEIKASRFFGGCVQKAKMADQIVAVKIFASNEKKAWDKERDFYNLPFMKVGDDNVLKFITAFKREGLGEVDHTTSALSSQYWLITEYHDKGSLYDFLKHNSSRQNHLSIQVAVRMLTSIAQGLQFLHSPTFQDRVSPSDSVSKQRCTCPKPVVAHRDIKSRNILVKDNLSCCIGDFGLAMVLGNKDLMNVSQVGTIRYMSPELLACLSEYSKTSFLNNDYYALALVMWEIMSMVQDEESHIEGTSKYCLPYEDKVGLNPTVEDMHQVVVGERYRPFLNPQWKNNQITSSVATSIDDMWDSDPEARINTYLFLHRLDSLQAQRHTGDSECHFDNNNKDHSKNITINNNNNFYNSPQQLGEHGVIKIQEGINTSSIDGSYNLLDQDKRHYFINKNYAITESNESVNKKNERQDGVFSNNRLEDRPDEALLIESLQKKGTPMNTSTELDHNINAPNILTIDMDDDYLVPPFNLIKMATPLPATVANNDDVDANNDATKSKMDFSVIGSDNYINKNNIFSYSPSTVYKKDSVSSGVFNFNSPDFLNENQINEIDHFQNKYDNNKNVYVNKNNQKTYETDNKNTHAVINSPYDDNNKHPHKTICNEEGNVYKNNDGAYNVDINPLVVVVADDKAPVPSPV